jgi:hypothetical protein
LYQKVNFKKVLKQYRLKKIEITRINIRTNYCIPKLHKIHYIVTRNDEQIEQLIAYNLTSKNIIGAKDALDTNRNLTTSENFV